MIATPNNTNEDLIETRVLLRIEERIKSVVGKWALACMGTVILFSSTAAFQWAQVSNRIDSIEKWRDDRMVDLKDREIRIRKLEVEMVGLRTDIENIKANTSEILKEMRTR